MSLYKAETQRLVKRRFTRYFTLGALIVLMVVAAGVFFTNQKATPDTLAGAQAQAEAEYQNGIVEVKRYRAECEKAKDTPQFETNFPGGCGQIVDPAREQYQADWYMDPTFGFRDGFGPMQSALAGVLALVAFVIGASYVGAEWNSGGMMNLLLWRPQRLKVLGTKLAALVVGLTALTVVTSLVWTGVMWLVAVLRGNTDKVTSGVWQSFGLTGLRGLGLVLAAGVIGFGMASLGRNTATAFGAAIGVVVVFQAGLGTVLELADVAFVEAYLVPTWGLAWMDKTVKLENYDACNTPTFNGVCEPDTLILSWQMAGGAMAAILVLLVGAAMWTMRSRDIT